MFKQDTSFRFIKIIAVCVLLSILLILTFIGIPVSAVNDLEENQTILITIDDNPQEGGVLSGEGSYSVGDSVTRKAVPNDSYLFINWTENEEDDSIDCDNTTRTNNQIIRFISYSSSTASPSNPTLISPANNTTVSGTGDDKRITFHWNSSTGADRYQMRVRHVGNTSWIESSESTNTYRIFINFPNDGTQYEWQARAGNSAGQWSSWSPSTPWRFTNGGGATLSFTNLTPSSITTSTRPYDPFLTATGANFNNVNQITFSWSGASTGGSATWNRGDNNWNQKVDVISNTSMTLEPRVVGSTSTSSGTDTWTVTLKDTSGAIRSRTFTVTYNPSPTTYNLSVGSTNPSSGVTISSSTGHGGTTGYSLWPGLSSGTSVTLTAPQYVGSGVSRTEFSNWSGSISSTNRTISFTMTGSRSVTANYVNDPSSSTPPRVRLRAPANNASVAGTRVVFRWNAATGATRYQLQVRRASNNTIFRNLRPGNVTQRAIQNFPATGVQYKWRVRAGNAASWGPWSAYRNLNLNFGGAFNHNFNTTSGYQGWVRRPQALWSLNNQAMLTATAGLDGFTSARRGNFYYDNLDYSVRMQRTGSAYSSSGIVIRAGSEYKANGDWYPGYQLLYRNDGTYSIWKISANGAETSLQNWTPSNHINKKGWNTLRVIAVGNNLRFYINGQLVKNLNDSSIKSGFVGVIAKRSTTDPASDRLLVDWARLSLPVAGSQAAMEKIDPEQQVFNEAAQSETATGAEEELRDPEPEEEIFEERLDPAEDSPAEEPYEDLKELGSD